MNQVDKQKLREKFHGGLVSPADKQYNETRALWNGMIDKKPALIARCKDTEDVINAVNFAREQGLTVAVRGGGHSVAGLSSVDDGIMIDLSLMKAVHVDSQARTARVEGGALWADLDRETQRFGLATPGGIISTTGVAGLTLGGGFGWLSRLHGLAADNLLSVSVITAAGQNVTASKDNNADLFWAVRGGGGNFGIVTSFEFELHEVGPEVLFGPTVYRLEDAPEVLRHCRDFLGQAPNNCSINFDFLTAPPLPFLPEEVHGTKVLSVVQFYAGSVDEGKELLRPVREFGDPLGDGVGSVSYTTAQSMVDPLYEKGANNYWKSHNLTGLSDEIIDTLVGCARKLPNPQSDILIQQLGGAINSFAPDATAYPHRDTEFVVTPGGRWENETEEESCIAWVRECHDALAQHLTAGVYVNFLGHGEEDRLRLAYSDNFKRLMKVKAKYDPENFFHINQNIKPAEGSQ